MVFRDKTFTLGIKLLRLFKLWDHKYVYTSYARRSNNNPLRHRPITIFGNNNCNIFSVGRKIKYNYNINPIKIYQNTYIQKSFSDRSIFLNNFSIFLNN